MNAIEVHEHEVRNSDGTLVGVITKGLSVKEVETLMLRAQGQTAKESAKELNISHNVVNKRQQNINFKLGTKDTTQSIAEAFKRGILAYAMCLIAFNQVTERFSAARVNTARGPSISFRIPSRTRQEYAG